MSRRKTGTALQQMPVAASPTVFAVSRRVQRWLIGIASGLALLGGSVATFIFAGGPGWLQMQASDVTARAGFSVNRIEIHGARYTSSLDIHAVLNTEQGAILFASLADIRARLEKIAWVRNATVQRQLPDRLVIHLVERTPFAIWQHRSELSVIDSTGVPLTRARLDRFAHLPIVVGENAQIHAAQLLADLARAANLRDQLDSAVWVGNRRWNVKFRSGEILLLPEGEKMQKSAIFAFSQLQSGYQLLGRGSAHFDMRLGDRLFVGRVNAEASDKPPAKKTETSI